MSAAVFIRPDRGKGLPERLVIFVFLCWGALSAAFELFTLPPLPDTRLRFSLLLGSMLLFSASGFGLLLIPLEMLLFGNYFQSLVLSRYAASSAPLSVGPGPLLFASILFLSVFLAATYGLGASCALRTALFRGSPSARGRYQRQLTAAALCSLVSLADAFYFA